MDERLLLQRLVFEAVDMNEVRRYSTDTTQLPRVRVPSSYNDFISIAETCLQCFDAVGWAAGRASGL